MKIETKFEPNQEVYYISYDKIIHKIKIFSIEIYETNSLHIVKYGNVNGELYDESSLFATREEAEQKLKEIGE